MKRLALFLVPLSLVLAACEDADNPGDDSALTGGSLVLLILIAAVAFAVWLLARRR